MSQCCNKCKDICNCLNLLSYDNSVLIEKDVCTGQCNIVLQVNPQFVTDNETPWTGNSSSLVITPGGVNGHAPNIEIVPSSDPCNVFDLGTDGKPYVPCPQILNFIDTNTVDFTVSGNNVTADVRIDPLSTAPITVTNAGIKFDCCPDVDVNINNIPGLSFTKSKVGKIITFTPTLDFEYIASQVCPLCPVTPVCNPITNLIVNSITSTSVSISWTGNGSLNYVVRYRLSTNMTWTTLSPQLGTTATITGLTPGSSYLIEVINDCGNGLTATAATVATTPYESCPNVTDVTVTVSEPNT